MKLLIASNNKHKIDEIKQILSKNFSEIYSLEELGISCDPEENGATFSDNALIKANEIAKHTDMAVLADDTGLCVDFLGGKPGVFSARYAGNHDHAANRRKILQEMANATDRSAHFCTAVALRYPDGKIVCAEGRVDGRILTEETGANGFGYDSIFFSNDLGKSFGEATAEEKNSVSHRGRALQSLLSKIDQK